MYLEASHLSQLTLLLLLPLLRHLCRLLLQLCLVVKTILLRGLPALDFSALIGCSDSKVTSCQ